MPEALITLGVALSAVALDDWLGNTERTFRRRNLEERPSYSDENIYSLYYADSGLPRRVVIESWCEIAKVLQVERGRLRPNDRLGGFLGYHKMIRSSRSDIERLVKLARSRARASSQPAPSRLSTVDDVMQCLLAHDVERFMLMSA